MYQIIMNLHQENNNSPITLLMIHIIFKHMFMVVDRLQKPTLEIFYNYLKQTCCVSDNNISILFYFYWFFEFQDFRLNNLLIGNVE